MTEPDEKLGAPDPSRGGETVEAAIDSAEEGSAAEGDHTPPPPAGREVGESRLEQLREVDTDD